MFKFHPKVPFSQLTLEGVRSLLKSWNLFLFFLRTSAEQICNMVKFTNKWLIFYTLSPQTTESLKVYSKTASTKHRTLDPNFTSANLRTQTITKSNFIVVICRFLCLSHFLSLASFFFFFFLTIKHRAPRVNNFHIAGKKLLPFPLCLSTLTRVHTHARARAMKNYLLILI